MAPSNLELPSAPGFTLHLEDAVAVIRIDLPDEPVNTLSPEVGEAFTKLLDWCEREDAVRAIVFASGKKDSFIAGAKIDFLQTLRTAAEATALSRRAQEGFNRLEAARKPVVAAIHGACLGGGLEWALACTYRIASDAAKTQLGLPEVQLGLIPGAGGTQRLPRLIGVQSALPLILTGKQVRAQKARKLGIVDEVVPAPILIDVARRRAEELAAGTLHPDEARSRAKELGKGRGITAILRGLADREKWAELALEENALGRRLLFEQARKQLLKRTRGKYPAPERALEAVRVGFEEGLTKGLDAEAHLFGELCVSDVSKRLVELFFAQTALKKENGLDDGSVKARDVRRVAVVGGGLMGGGIAYLTASQLGVPVRLKDRDDAGVGRALRQVRTVLDERVRRRSLTWREADAKLALVTGTLDYSGFRQADLVVEAVFEELGLKQQVLGEVEAVTREDCIFASNTSSLPISKIAEASKHPETVVGMHYFSPVHKMPLLEVVRQPKTADWVIATCVDVGRRQGKTVIVVNDGVGFYTSRILAPYLNEAAHLLNEGADIAEVDRSLVDFGFPVGPFTLLDEVGIDVAEKVGKIMFEAFGSRITPPPDAFGKLTADGRFGRKSRKGFYTYGSKKKEVDASVYDLLPHGRDRKKLDRHEIMERLVLQFVNEAVRCLGDGVLRQARDGDVGAIFGLGFPPFLGGPFRYVDAQGAARILERTEHFHRRLGERFTPAPMLVEVARQARTFHPR